MRRSRCSSRPTVTMRCTGLSAWCNGDMYHAAARTVLNDCVHVVAMQDQAGLGESQKRQVRRSASKATAASEGLPQELRTAALGSMARRLDVGNPTGSKEIELPQQLMAMKVNLADSLDLVKGNSDQGRRARYLLINAVQGNAFATGPALQAHRPSYGNTAGFRQQVRYQASHSSKACSGAPRRQGCAAVRAAALVQCKVVGRQYKGRIKWVVKPICSPWPHFPVICCCYVPSLLKGLALVPPPHRPAPAPTREPVVAVRR